MAVLGGVADFWPDTALFCSACGGPLATRPSFMAARKTVTVVFADVVGSNGHAAACVALGEVLRDHARPQDTDTAIRKALASY